MADIFTASTAHLISEGLQDIGSLILIGEVVSLPIRTRRKYERVVTRFFNDYVHYTHVHQFDKPHYDPGPSCIILGFSKSEEDWMDKFNKDNSAWWSRYSIFLQMYDSKAYHDLITELCDKCQIRDQRAFIKWVNKRDKKERQKRKIKAIKHNKEIDLYDSYKLKFPDIDYYEFML